MTGIAALLGGVAWVIKAGVILATGNQPEYVFEVAPILFFVGLIGLYLHLAGRGGTVSRIGGIVAVAGLVVVSIGFVRFLGGTSSGGEEEFDPLIFGSFVLVVVSLTLLGIGYRRGARDRLKWPSLPFIVGLVTIPMVMIGGGLEAVNERLLEVPILLLGAAWIAIGVDLASSEPTPVLTG